MLFNTQRPAPPRLEDAIAKAVLVASVIVMRADGATTREEMIELANLCSFSPIFAAFGSHKTVEMLVQAEQEASTKSIDQMIQESAQVLSPALRETAICFAYRVAMADGRLDQAEEVVLIKIAAHYGVPFETYSKIVDVFGMLQRSDAA